MILWSIFCWLKFTLHILDFGKICILFIISKIIGVEISESLRPIGHGQFVYVFLPALNTKTELNTGQWKSSRTTLQYTSKGSLISLRPDPPGSYPPTTNSVHVHCGKKHANCMSRFSQWEADALNVNKFLLIRTADSAVYRYDIRQRKNILKTWRGFNSCLKMVLITRYFTNESLSFERCGLISATVFNKFS